MSGGYNLNENFIWNSHTHERRHSKSLFINFGIATLSKNIDDQVNNLVYQYKSVIVFYFVIALWSVTDNSRKKLDTISEISHAFYNW